HIGAFAGRKDTEILYICDADRDVGARRAAEVGKRQGGNVPKFEEDIRKVNDLVKGANNISPFPSCSRMDTNDKLQSIISTTDEIKDLKSFTEYIQHRILIDPETNKLLYYSEADIRCFIAGLGMSRLHLLQGISGTGKTSLPLAFARAIGAGQALIEVQAGWRDRQDLIGHFNTFERRFYESEFLQALYKASCPQYSDKPFIVVLDEMNLSHPEQYFADLLSALEQEKHRQRLVLMTAAVEPAPLLLEEGGRKFKIPENVWFIGTANHDETTKDFADKTYDRAHVMELPRHRKEFKPKELKPLSPIGYDALMNSFKMAVEKHSKTTNSAYEFLEKNLADLLGNKFGVGWGNRLERQMQDYVPIIIELGGSLGEATDHILASKLLRKIRDRHDNRPEDIIALRERINTEWPSLDPNSKPSKSFIILSDELRRLGNYEE
ncbi:MAG: AAA domain-containing protein, partial [Calditrichaeota bacterium]|nr:AAA domain-containing protein [Calditrichota bacterium]